MSTRTRERASAQDHLQALAAPLHPHVYPLYDWQGHVWRWVPPWMPADTRPEHGETLGRSYPAAARQLSRLLTKATCSHGQPLARRCHECRAAIITDLKGHAA